MSLWHASLILGKAYMKKGISFRVNKIGKIYHNLTCDSVFISNSSAMTVPAKTLVVVNMTLAPNKLEMIAPKVKNQFI